MEQEIILRNYYKLRICSDLEYEKMVVDIVYKNQTILTLNQEHGINKIEFKFYCTNISNDEIFTVLDFIYVLEEAKKLLIKINKNL
ncbi:MAG: hypothetical protein A3F40_02060 [Chlamydiae bacterium RIFCSPHIGHO2_12_FULL_27_8]|nr:MAG: hypothetical protein A3F40_02060 [Chlamydiae bacterium RIFCSPHIGHO2_12_FULL_27_8]OGN64828.1 MAG: hypothetical protein A2888_00880 [Chlamydiae bacterium RIFCSPLOWO2_01_FULL_28_7]